MKVAVSAVEKNLDAAVDPRFGRCAWIVLVDSDTMEVVGGGQNESANASGGAGPQTAQWIAEMGAEVIVTGRVGPRAMEALNAAKIQVYVDAGGTVREAVQQFLDGTLSGTTQATAPQHAGMNRPNQNR